ncbi:MAG TPA: FAD/NAD(P)-binding protein [Planctomycetaceae bacterium]
MTAAAPPRANPYETRAVEIAGVTAEIDGVATYRLVSPGGGSPADYAFEPGQFNMLYLPGVGEAAISMSGDPDARDGWVHTVRVAGNVTAALAGLRPGDALGLRGPFGAPWPVERLRGGDVLVVAGGVGLAPLRPLVYELLRRRRDYGRVALVIGARTPDGLLYRREYEAWRAGGIDVEPTVDRAAPGWAGHVGVVTPILDRLPLPDPERTGVVACGPEVMMKYAAASATARGVRPERVWVSLERNMQCAAGLCGHCQLGPAFVCKDGPVFRYDVIRPYLFVESL